MFGKNFTISQSQLNEIEELIRIKNQNISDLEYAVNDASKQRDHYKALWESTNADELHCEIRKLKTELEIQQMVNKKAVELLNELSKTTKPMKQANLSKILGAYNV